ncbi:MAG: PP2C family protein-serine/threonine phosphatase, partial [Candidatus Eisenbacteria bacterium]
QAGHPCPVLQRGDQLRRLGESGFPVGMLPGVQYEDITVPFVPGDRLFLYSDGVTECVNSASEPFRLERLEQTVLALRGDALEQTVAGIERELLTWRGGDEFADDVTLFALERRAA